MCDMEGCFQCRNRDFLRNSKPDRMFLTVISHVQRTTRPDRIGGESLLGQSIARLRFELLEDIRDNNVRTARDCQYARSRQVYSWLGHQHAPGTERARQWWNDYPLHAELDGQ